MHAAPTQESPAVPQAVGEDLTSVHRSGVDWQIVSGWRDIVLGADAPRWLRLEEDERAERVKEGDGRKVWRVAVGGRAFYAKVFESAGLWAAIRDRVVGDVALRELRRGYAARQRGVGVVSVIGAGMQRGAPRRSVLLSEEAPDAVTLTVAWRENAEGLEGTARRDAVERLCEPVARLYAEAHERGFLDDDGHPNNVLVFGDISEPLQALFVDLHAAKLTSPPVPQGDATKALGQLEHVFRRLASRSERLRFLHRYAELRGWRTATTKGRRRLRGWIAQVLAAQRRQAQQLARKRDRRIRRNGKYFATFEPAERWRATVNLALERRHLFSETGIADRDEAQWRSILTEFISSGTGGRDLADRAVGEVRCLVHRAPNLVTRLAWTVSGSPARTAFEHCHRLRHRDVPAPLVLGYMEHRRGSLIDLAVELHPRDPFLAALADAPTDPRFVGKNAHTSDGDGT